MSVDPRVVAGRAGGAAAAVVAVAAAVDLFAAVLGGAHASSPATYVAAAVAIATGCCAVLVTLFARRAGRPPRGVALQLAALGLSLGAWWLRGHPGVPPDPPLIAAHVLAAALFAAGLFRARTEVDR